ncbi:hypothetical protein C8T65DRAFT_275841 [Cerioporus squamosus]|nr:hypothetical protein C8T65DRAFT_275841 [Cerioporus squamosus]
MYHHHVLLTRFPLWLPPLLLRLRAYSCAMVAQHLHLANGKDSSLRQVTQVVALPSYMLHICGMRCMCSRLYPSLRSYDKRISLSLCRQSSAQDTYHSR